jgi:hypothetical protein
VSAFIGTTIGPVCGGLALLSLGRIEDSMGNGGDQGCDSMVDYHYSQYGCA